MSKNTLQDESGNAESLENNCNSSKAFEPIRPKSNTVIKETRKKSAIFKYIIKRNKKKINSVCIKL